jgi:1-acyl-sn-glycerol-3-phosphate acyltransferase
MPDDRTIKPPPASVARNPNGRRAIASHTLAGSALAGSCRAASAEMNSGDNPLLWSLAFGVVVGIVVSAMAYRRDPHQALRFLTDLLIHAFYRLGTRGLEHVPANGPAVLVCNHVSFADSLIVMAAIRRPIRFVIDHRIYETPVANTLFRHSRTIPIATAKENPAQKEAAFAEVASALRNGELIGLFPEGGITRNGEIDRFRYGVGRIVDETPVPVVPMALRGLWGSFYSRRYGAAMSKPSCLRPRAAIELVAGPAVPPQDVTPEALQQIVGELRGDWR